MSCSELLANALPRISARRGQTVDLDISFYRNGALTDPFAVRFVEIYKGQVLPHNLVVSVPVVSPDDSTYPSPVCQETVAAETGDCGTEPDSDAEVVTGKFHLPYAIPNDFEVPDVYFDVWYYFPDDPCADTTSISACDIDDAAFDGQLIKCCQRFWVYPDEWFCTGGLKTLRFGFEPLDIKYHTPELRPLEVGLMPLPLYEYDFNMVQSLIPLLKPTITIQTRHNEILAQNDPCSIGLRQGNYRSNPWVVQYMLDTTKFLKGTYQYQITIALPDGTSRVSSHFHFSVQ